MTKTVSLLLPAEWSAIDRQVKTVDEDRWLSSRYAPRDKRRALVSLYAFNYELARIRLVASELTLGAIRFQWWREALEGIKEDEAVPEHDIARAIAEDVREGHVRIEVLESLLDRHEKAFEEKDRSLEPEAILMGIAVHILSPKHGWGQCIRKVAPAYAIARRGESKAFGPAVDKAPTRIRPAVSHAALRYAYAKGDAPGALKKRAIVLKAMLTGKV